MNKGLLTFFKNKYKILHYWPFLMVKGKGRWYRNEIKGG